MVTISTTAVVSAHRQQECVVPGFYCSALLANNLDTILWIKSHQSPGIYTPALKDPGTKFPPWQTCITGCFFPLISEENVPVSGSSEADSLPVGVIFEAGPHLHCLKIYPSICFFNHSAPRCWSKAVRAVCTNYICLLSVVPHPYLRDLWSFIADTLYNSQTSNKETSKMELYLCPVERQLLAMCAKLL